MHKIPSHYVVQSAFHTIIQPDKNPSYVIFVMWESETPKKELTFPNLLGLAFLVKYTEF